MRSPAATIRTVLLSLRGCRHFVAAAMIGLNVPGADAAENIANAFVGGRAPATSAKTTVMPYTSIVAPAPFDTSLDRTGFRDDAEATAAKAPEPDSPKASAGDDVLAYVGRRATLNGGLSQPVGRIGMRWIQIAGPPVREAFSQGPNLIVVPPEAGAYQFLLVVAEGGRISEPDTVLLTAVTHPEDEAKRRAALTMLPVQDDADVTRTAPVSTRALFVRAAAAAIDHVPHKPETAQSLATVFSEVSQKMSLYVSYAEAHQELSRRIIAVTESDSIALGDWNRTVFEPLTAALAMWVRPAGMDLADASLWTAPLAEPARSRLAEGLAAIAEGFRGDGPKPIADRAIDDVNRR